MANNPAEKLDRLIEDLQKQVEQTKLIRAAIGSDPEYAAKLVKALLPVVNQSESGTLFPSSNGTTELKPAKDRGGPTAQEHFQKIWAFLSVGDERGHTTNEIHRGTGLEKYQIHNIITRTHPHRFGKARHPDDSRSYLIRLKSPQELRAKGIEAEQ